MLLRIFPRPENGPRGEDVAVGAGEIHRLNHEPIDSLGVEVAEEVARDDFTSSRVL